MPIMFFFFSFLSSGNVRLHSQR